MNTHYNGFLRADGQRIVNGAGDPIILKGWGLGNWLLPEGYMWLARGNQRFDRPRRIEAVIRELTGEEYSQRFWSLFRARYVTRDDIKAMAELGYNSVRIPFMSRLFLKEGPGIEWVDEGFKLLDRCLEWCEEFGIYAWLDLHGAPGGQTGANIDDCVDDLPRLFTDSDNLDKCIALWVKLAERYKDREIVAGYDLLNEPLRTPNGKDADVEYLVPRLCEFYDAAIAAIRTVDTNHMFSIEGHHWSTDTAVFYKVYDPNMCIHFHRYGSMPDVSCYREWLDLSERLNLPLWLGETGENKTEWFTAMYPLAEALGFGYNVWPWKKMKTENSPMSVKEPDGWDKIHAYINGGPHPGFAEAQAIFDRYLDNILYDNCDRNALVDQSVLRRTGCTIRATDFDHLPGRGVSYSGLRGDNPHKYRIGAGMGIIEKYPHIEKRRGFDSGWDRFALSLEAGEYACYTLNDIEQGSMLSLTASGDATVELSQDGSPLGSFEITSGELSQTDWLQLRAAATSVLKLTVTRGDAVLDAVHTR